MFLIDSLAAAIPFYKWAFFDLVVVLVVAPVRAILGDKLALEGSFARPPHTISRFWVEARCDLRGYDPADLLEGVGLVQVV